MISDIEFKKLQQLAKLNFLPEEKETFYIKLEGVLNMINSIHDLDCKDIEPLRSVCEMNQRMQEDKVTISNISQELFKNVPGNSASFAQEIKCFIVPKVVE